MGGIALIVAFVCWLVAFVCACLLVGLLVCLLSSLLGLLGWRVLRLASCGVFDLCFMLFVDLLHCLICCFGDALACSVSFVMQVFVSLFFSSALFCSALLCSVLFCGSVVRFCVILFACWRACWVFACCCLLCCFVCFVCLLFAVRGVCFFRVSSLLIARPNVVCFMVLALTHSTRTMEPSTAQQIPKKQRQTIPPGDNHPRSCAASPKSPADLARAPGSLGKTRHVLVERLVSYVGLLGWLACLVALMPGELVC